MLKLVRYLLCAALVFALALPAAVVQASTDPSDAVWNLSGRKPFAPT